MKVTVSGGLGKLGGAIAQGIILKEGMELSGIYSPGHSGARFNDISIIESTDNLDAQIIVECAPPSAVMQNLRNWCEMEVSVVVGTSGFTEERLEELKSFWTDDKPGCLIVPNFSIGAVLMMRFAEMAATHFDSAEIIERHAKSKRYCQPGTQYCSFRQVRCKGIDEGCNTDFPLVNTYLGCSIY